MADFRQMLVVILDFFLISFNLGNVHSETNLDCYFGTCRTEICTTNSIICSDGHLFQVPMVSPFVEYLNLSHNVISELKQKSFVHLPILIDLDLSHNKIQQIPDRVFAGLGNLKKLYLNHNRINHIGIFGFRNLHELEELHLESNLLKNLDETNIFRELFNLNYLSIFKYKENELKRLCNQSSTIGQNDRNKLPFCSNSLRNKTEPKSELSQNQYKSIVSQNEIRKQAIPMQNHRQIYRPTVRITTPRPRSEFRFRNPKNTGNPPLLTSVPESIHRIKLGSEISLMCEAVGEPKPDFKWTRFGRAVSFNSSFNMDKVTPEDEGIYECIARNINGKAAKEIKIILIGTISSDSDLNINRDLLEEIINSTRYNETVQIGDLITTDVLKFVDLFRLLMAYSDNQTMFMGMQLIDSNLLTPVQATVMNNFTGCIGGARFETFNCEEEEYDEYYSITGICNNKQNPSWGASVEPFLRLLPAEYEDGLVKPIGWFENHHYHHGFSKPSPRRVTKELLSTKKITNDPQHNHLLMQFGQFLDHDITFAALSDNRNLLENDRIDCERLCQPVEPCYSIFDPNEERCIEFKRSAEYCGTGFSSVFFGKLIQREQVNMLTAFIDGSQIYGSNDELAEFLQSPNVEQNGLLNATLVGNQSYLPLHDQFHLTMDCQPQPEYYSNDCYLAGDHRANEQLGLLVFHNLWLRNHNNVATKLRMLKSNEEWTGEKIFQETRKIIAAQLQIITYRDWLPLIVGSKGMEILGEYKGYVEDVNPSIANSFAAAAMRFGHTLVNKNLMRRIFQKPHSYESKSEDTNLHKTFFKPNLLTKPNLSDSVLLGLLMTPLKKTMPEQAITDELTEKLFKLSRYKPLDLSSINIQRGRDHALPDYNKWRVYCGLTKAETFDDLKYEIRNKNIRDKLKKLYGHPSNIDLYVGGILEESDDDAKVGPTFRCLLVDQFKRLRDGDRFFYQNKGVFTENQLKELEKTNLSKLICNNGDNIISIVPNSFFLPRNQSWIECKHLQDIDLTHW